MKAYQERIAVEELSFEEALDSAIADKDYKTIVRVLENKFQSMGYESLLLDVAGQILDNARTEIDYKEPDNWLYEY